MWDVICIGNNCKKYDKCTTKCTRQLKFRKYLKGCHYSNNNECNDCSHKSECYLCRPYSNELKDVEIRINDLRQQIKTLNDDVNVYDEGEYYFPLSKSQMMDKIKDLKDLLRDYYDYEKELMDDLMEGL